MTEVPKYGYLVCLDDINRIIWWIFFKLTKTIFQMRSEIDLDVFIILTRDPMT